MQLASIWLAPLFLLSLTSLCLGQQTQQQERAESEADSPASSAHNYMELFTRLERDCSLAAQQKDKVALDAIIAPEFMLRTSENPENPQPRTEWIEHALSSRRASVVTRRSMAIRAFLGVAVVSFVQTEKVTVDGKDRSRDYFIVDLWKASHDKWQICTRYVSPIAKPSPEDMATSAGK